MADSFYSPPRLFAFYHEDALFNELSRVLTEIHTSTGLSANTLSIINHSTIDILTWIALSIFVFALLKMHIKQIEQDQIIKSNQALEAMVAEQTQALLTAQKETESILRFRNGLLNNSLICIVFVKGKKIEWINDYAEVMFGLSKDNYQGKEADLIFHNKSDYLRLLRSAPSVLSKGANYQTELPFRHQDGTQLWCLVNGKALNPSNLAEGVVYIIVDITDRKRMEDQLKHLNSQLENQAITDDLTGISNRRRIRQLLEKECQRANRYLYSFSIILLDLDHFKYVNDNFGHDAGDKVLKSVARLLQSTIRQVDTCARWGGEEFLILCPHTELSDAVTMAELLRKRLQDMKQPPAPNITASFGVACFQPGDSLVEILKASDIALYEAKSNRNEVRYHTPSKIGRVSDLPKKSSDPQSIYLNSTDTK